MSLLTTQTQKNGDVYEFMAPSCIISGMCKIIYADANDDADSSDGSEHSGYEPAEKHKFMEGNYENGKFNGICKLTTRDHVTEGNYINGKFIGKCTRTHLNRKYKIEGTFKNGDFAGICVCTFEAMNDWYYGNTHRNKCNTLTGNYINGEFKGHCVIQYKNGDKMEGNYENGSFNGPCVKTFANGDKLEGKCRRNDFEGEATKTFANGRVVTGFVTSSNQEFYPRPRMISIACPECQVINREFRLDDFVTFSVLTNTVCCHCKTAPPNVLFPKCKHLVMCDDCVNKENFM